MTARPTYANEPQRGGDRWEQGLAAYASQFQIAPDQVAAWCTERVGARFGEEAIYAAARAWTDDELSLRDRSLAVLASLITMGGAEPQLRMPPAGQSITAVLERRSRRWQRSSPSTPGSHAPRMASRSSAKSWPN